MVKYDLTKTLGLCTSGVVAQWHINEAGRSNVRTFGDNRDIGDPARDPAIRQPEPAHDEIIQQHVSAVLFCFETLQMSLFPS